MKHEVKKYTEKYEKGKWVVTCETDEKERIYKDLSYDLLVSKVWKGSGVKKLVDKTNYDGTRTIYVFYGNGFRSKYIVEL